MNINSVKLGDFHFKHIMLCVIGILFINLTGILGPMSWFTNVALVFLFAGTAIKLYIKTNTERFKKALGIRRILRILAIILLAYGILFANPFLYKAFICVIFLIITDNFIKLVLKVNNT